MRIFGAGLAILLCAPLGGAQPLLLRLSSGGNTSLAGSLGGAVLVQSPSDTVLQTVIHFGDVGPNNRNSYVCLTQPLFLRARIPSSLRAALTINSFGNGPGDLQTTDIGIGIQNLQASGKLADISTTTVAAGFDADPCAAPKDGDGVPTFSTTLSDLGVGAPGTTVIQSAGPISPRGGRNSQRNRVELTLRLAIAPQAFTAGNFSATLTLTLTSP